MNPLIWTVFMGYIIWENTALQAKTRKITHILIQQLVPECTADDKREFIQSLTPIRKFGKHIRETNTTFGHFEEYNENNAIQ
jgi:hypothetical protein